MKKIEFLTPIILVVQAIFQRPGLVTSVQDICKTTINKNCNKPSSLALDKCPNGQRNIGVLRRNFSTNIFTVPALKPDRLTTQCSGKPLSTIIDLTEIVYSESEAYLLISDLTNNRMCIVDSSLRTFAVKNFDFQIVSTSSGNCFLYSVSGCNVIRVHDFFGNVLNNITEDEGSNFVSIHESPSLGKIAVADSAYKRILLCDYISTSIDIHCNKQVELIDCDPVDVSSGDGKLLVACTDGTIRTFVDKKQVEKLRVCKTSIVGSLFRDASNNIVATCPYENGPLFINTSTGQRRRLGSNKRIYSVFQIAGNLYFGFQGGVFRYSANYHPSIEGPSLDEYLCNTLENSSSNY